MANKTVLITGATGHQGGAIAHELLRAGGFNVHALTRKPDGEPAKALAKAGAKIVAGDFDDAASLSRALDGVWGVFGMANTWEVGVVKEEEEAKRTATIAREKGVEHYVYSSVGSAHRKTGIPHFDNKFRVEEKVRSLGFPSTVILRPVYFMENLLSPWTLNGDKLMLALPPTKKLQMIAVEDIGKLGARAFTHAKEMNGAEIDMAGDEVTMPEAAATLSEALGKKLTFVQVPLDAVRQNSEDMALMLEWFDKVGYNADIEGVQKKYGLEFDKLADWARQQCL